MALGTYTEISRLLATGATLGEVEAYIEARTRGLSEDALSALWLREWYALEHPGRERLGWEPSADLSPLD